MTLTKAELSDILLDRADFRIHRNEAKLLVELFYEEIRACLLFSPDE